MSSGVFDENGVEVKEGDNVHFSFGIPPIGVDALISVEGGEYVVNTPRHTPKKSPLSELESHVGTFWVMND